MILLIIRHGDPIYKPDSLTELGRKQAEALAPRLAAGGVDEIYCSPLNRARQTAQPTAELLGLPVKIEEWMSEDTAFWEMRAVLPDGRKTWLFHQDNTVINSDETAALGDRWYEADCFAARDMKSAYQRISDASDEFLARLGYVREGRHYRIVHPSEKRIACFCHQGFGTTWLSWLLRAPPPVFWGSFDINHTGVSVLRFDNRPSGITAPKCIALSDCSHLYASGLPYRFQNKDPL